MQDTFSGGTTTLNPGCGDRSRHRSIHQGPGGWGSGRSAAVGAMLFGGTLCATSSLQAGGDELLATFSGGSLGVFGSAYSSQGESSADGTNPMMATSGSIGGSTGSGPVFATGMMEAEIDGDLLTTTVRFLGSGEATNLGGDADAFASVSFGTSTDVAETIRLSITEECFFSIANDGDVSVSFVAETGGSGSLVGDTLSAGIYLISLNDSLYVGGFEPTTDSFDLDWTLTLTTVPAPGALAVLVPGLLGIAGSRRRRS